jgi:hypothetical protein
LQVAERFPQAAPAFLVPVNYFIVDRCCNLAQAGLNRERSPAVILERALNFRFKDDIDISQFGKTVDCALARTLFFDLMIKAQVGYRASPQTTQLGYL